MPVSLRRSALLTAGVCAIALVGVGAQGRHPISGRILAPTMGVEGAPWLDRPEREAEEAPSKAIDALSIQPSSVVADVGAGSGYYTVLLSKAVGPGGRVVATDLQSAMLDLIRARVAREGLTNVSLVQGRSDDPNLSPATFDLILMVDVYHELASPQVFVRRLRAALRPTGRLVLIEFRLEDARVPIKEVHKMSVDQVRTELGAEGFTIDKVIDVLPWQHIIVLRSAGL